LFAFWLLGRAFFGGQLITGLILFVIGLIFICILGIYSIIDSYRVASNR
jgi:hypothetical protein